MRIVSIILSLFIAATLFATDKLPKGVEKGRAAVVSILAYKDGELLRSGTGVFAGDNGDILSSYTLFVGADSAVAIDPSGKVRPVQRILGASELYDCIRLRTARDKKIKPLKIPQTDATNNEQLFLIPYGTKNSATIEPITVTGVEKGPSGAYYTLSFKMQERLLAAPLLNAEGELTALMQPAFASDSLTSYALSAAFVASLNITALNYNSSELQRIAIPRALPAEQKEALTCLNLQRISYDKNYFSMLDDYIATFPDSYEGHLMLAEKQALNDKNLPAAEASWEKALDCSPKPDDVYYNKASVLRTIAETTQDSTERKIMTGRAIEHYDKALSIANEPLYLLNKGYTLFNAKNHTEAFNCFAALYHTNMRSSELFLHAAECKELTGDYDAAIAQLDSATAILGTAFEREIIFAKAQLKSRAGRYREAVVDYNRFEELSNSALSAQFYFMRYQAAYAAKLFQIALNDIETATSLQPRNVLYLIEKAHINYRVNMIDEAIRTLTEALTITTESPDVYYMLGRCQLIKEDKASAKENFRKAKELGHPDAQNMLEQTD